MGKLNLSCAKPVSKKVMFVYVNTGTGYRNYPKDRILDSLNHHSHNQLLRNWVLYTPPDSLTHYNLVSNTEVKVAAGSALETLDLTEEFNTYNAKFMADDTLLAYIETWYGLHKNNISIKNDINEAANIYANNSEKVHVVFIYNYVLPTSVLASSQLYISQWWSLTNWQDAAHEMGHLLGIRHTFPETVKNRYFPHYNIPQNTTSNFMDYFPKAADISNMFYYAQWKKVY